MRWAPLLLGIALLQAADDSGQLYSLRVVGTALPQPAELELTATGPGGTVTSTTSDDWDASGRIAVGIYVSQDKPAGFYAGCGLAFSGFRFGEAGVAIEQTQAGAYVEAGVFWRPTERFSIELGLPLGLGGTSIDYTEPGYTMDGTGVYAEIGVVARPVLHLDRSLVFLELGGVRNSASYPDATVTPPLPGVSWDALMRTSGAYVALGIGVHW